MPLTEAVQLTVERPVPGVVVIRVAGNLDRLSAVRILGLVEQQLLMARSRPDMRNVDIVVDLSDVRYFGTGGAAGLSDHRMHAPGRDQCGLPRRSDPGRGEFGLQWGDLGVEEAAEALGV